MSRNIKDTWTKPKWGRIEGRSWGWLEWRDWGENMGTTVLEQQKKMLLTAFDKHHDKK